MKSMAKPMISVVMPVFNSEEFLEEAIMSIIDQTYKDWEFIIVLEAKSSSESKVILDRYEKKDKRIIIVENKYKLGLAESLNKGIGIAKGEYIARTDADDYSYPDRLAVQLEFMNSRVDVDLCATLQHTLLPSGEKTKLEVATDAASLKAEMLFGCQISHCSVMFRKDKFIENNWLYSTEFYGEDYELWTRLRHDIKYENIDECLVVHRYGFDNISIVKGDKLINEARKIIRDVIAQDFNIDVSQYEDYFFGTWRHNVRAEIKDSYSSFLLRSYKLLHDIERSWSNNMNKQYEREALAKMLCKRWNWTIDNTIFNGDYIKSQNIQIPYVKHKNSNCFHEEVVRALFGDEVNLKNIEEICVEKNIIKKIEVIQEHFNKILIDKKKIIVYGLSQDLLNYFKISKSNEKSANIVALTESKKSNRYNFKPIPLIEAKSIIDFGFDYILVSTRAFYDEIYSFLVEEMNVESEKILPPLALEIFSRIEHSNKKTEYKL